MTVPFLRNSSDFSFDSELLMQAAHFGMRIEEVPARGRYFEDASSVGLRSGIVYGLKTLWAAVRLELHRARHRCRRPSSGRPRPGRGRMTPTVTGERVVTAEGGFNPTWQRHVAAYALCGRPAGPGQVVDVGCGVGHSYQLLAPRETVGVDVDADALAGQDRQTVVADMRALPFADASFDAAISVHSIEHVPDADTGDGGDRPGPAAGRVGGRGHTQPADVRPPGRDHRSLPLRGVRPPAAGRAGGRHFGSVETAGIFGSERYAALFAAERRKLDALLRLDPLRLRRGLPRRLLQRLYDRRLTRERGRLRRKRWRSGWMTSAGAPGAGPLPGCGGGL